MLRKWATPLMIGTALVVTITGILLFFHAGGMVAHVSHEWIGWLMAVAIIAHVVLNWKSFKLYFKKPIARVIIAAGVVLTLLAFVPSMGGGEGGERGGDPRSAMMNVMHGLENAPLDSLAQVSGASLETIQSILSEQGLEGNASENLNEIVSDNGQKMRILSQIFQAD